MNVRTRIALAAALTSVVATVAVGFVAYRITADRLSDAVDRSLVEAGSVAVAVAAEGRRLPERSALDRYPVQTVLADGKVAASTFEQKVPLSTAETALIGSRGRTSFRTAQVGRHEYRIRAVGFPNGVALVGRDLRENNEVLSELRLRIGLLVAAVAVLAAAVGSLVAGRITGGLRRLTATAEAVEATGDLVVDMPDDGGRDEVARLTTAFRRMLDALERSRADQARLVQDAGHELRTPLTSIRTNLDMLDRYGDLDAATRTDILDALRVEARELTVLVNEIVEVASGQRDDTEPVEVAVSEVIAPVVERLAQRTGREVMLNADDSRVVVRPAALARAVSNLVDNAAKFDASESPIEVSVDNGRIAVADRGPGIAAADRERIFERFHRADTARTLPGSGLGLSIVSDVASVHGGHVFVEDRDGGGAVIGLVLPALSGWEPPSAT